MQPDFVALCISKRCQQPWLQFQTEMLKHRTNLDKKCEEWDIRVGHNWSARLELPDDLHLFASGVCIPIREFYAVLEGNFPGIMLNQGMHQKAISRVRHPHYVTCFTYSEAWAEYMKGMDEKNYYVTSKNVHRYKRARHISSSGDEKEEEKRRGEEEARPLGTSEDDLHAEKSMRLILECSHKRIVHRRSRSRW